MSAVHRNRAIRQRIDPPRPRSATYGFGRSGAAPLVTNLVGGELASAFIDSSTARPPLKSKSPITVTSTQRMPDVPRRTKLSLLRRLRPARCVPARRHACAGGAESFRRNRLHRAPARHERKIEALRLQLTGGKPEAFQKVVRTDAAIYAKIIEDANIGFAQYARAVATLREVAQDAAWSTQA
ncbi:hypothetical protein [Variovorax sp. EBFNA2]|uniref:hypothetical protein n=1 Tax=Variovorax sp. EBFNA2 TaxID=3342097 RepID=UPI0029C03486|nr:hypothetical protein [Variovorax boronicumulans]WPG41436.1 hypothetical protein RZE79_31475 [Variovorax boronicumulans]